MVIAEAYTKCYEKITRHGHVVKLSIIDICSTDLKRVILKIKGDLELVPPHQHRWNAAERAIRTAKNYLLARLATCNPDYPIAEWDRLLTQSEIILSLLRNSRVTPKLSAWAYHNGFFDFDKIPIAPLDTKIVMHSNPDQRASWAYYGLEGFYVSPAPNQYRCLTCYLPLTRSEIPSDTVRCIPRYIPIPEISIDNLVKKTANNLFHLLLHKSTPISALHPEYSRQAIIKLAQILGRDTTPLILPIL